MLVEIAHRLKQVLRVDDTLARLGGDEFLLLLGPRPPVQARPHPLVQDTEEEEDTMDTNTMAR